MDMVLRLAGVSHRFGAVEVLRDVDLDLPAGTVTALVGPDGAGKTTLLRVAAGVLTPAAGRVERPGDAGIGYLAGASSVYPDLTVWENLTFFGRLYGMNGRALAAEAGRLLAWAGLEAFRHRPARHLSGGMRQKLALACALIHRPAVALLDEPTTGVDPVARRELWALLDQLAAGGMAVLVATPYMDEAGRCRRVALLHRGRLLAAGSPEELRARVPCRVLLLQAEGRRQELLRLARELPGVQDARPAGEGVRVALPVGAPDPTLPPGVRAVPAEVELEDVYVWLAGELAGKEPAGKEEARA
ncbi:ABC transporter ATP-binding protein [Thermaerobacter subterraneus]|uniref:ABC-type multidrug transport system, ATPase component n=1 Tax=Thermaerobacter subterraneus DSM 13965 TaxID=867903 RepID=K6PMI7_9FIRM|nr:ABC transporter ATP-binding protein [Thermaerobacter subterraneus]EKP94087.1 ABC-type multidrug transport system, ATPase component [Thermaerobacter subterraneus DSM 13965]